ncbi:hypothetical protein [Terriglobus sp.]|uniref:hypothetical protein n=1 Tax=Terriglobus sp. TaxID=1889013 RepID=UPI003B00C4D7
MKQLKALFFLAGAIGSSLAVTAVGQAVPALFSTLQASPAISDAEQTAQILGLAARMKQLSNLQGRRPCGSPVTTEELILRQELSESIQAAALDVDSVVAETNNEQGELANLRTRLQVNRDKTVAKYNTAALITGSGAGAAVSATQFTNLGSRANNIGDGFGIGAGVASTIFSVIATRKQNGPQGTVGEVPNMLAPLFDRKPVLNTFYPPVVLRYLQIAPANENPPDRTRLEELKAQWTRAGRLDPSQASRHHDIAPLTSSADPAVKVTIQDLTNRIAMLVDVSGRVSLMKRDLAVLMRSMGDSNRCPVAPIAP